MNIRRRHGKHKLISFNKRPFIIALAITVLSFSLGSFNFSFYLNTNFYDTQKLEGFINNALTVFSTISPSKTSFEQQLIESFLGFNINNPDSILKNQFSIFNLKSVLAGALPPEDTASNAEQENAPAPTPTPTTPQKKPIKEVTIVAADNGMYINNDTNYAIDVPAFLSKTSKLNLQGKGPYVLIIHTHTTEAYSPEGKDYYMTDDPTRSTDPKQNVVAVGNEMEKVFKNNGIPVIHDTTINDQPSFNGSYQKSMGVIAGYLKKYPSIKIVIDLHRDAMEQDDGTKLKTCVNIGGQKVAQVDFIMGTDASGLTDKNWRDNLTLALKFQKEIEKRYPNLARPINLRQERFNQQATTGSTLIEVGTNGNTLQEAILGAHYTAYAMAQVIKPLIKK